MIKISPDTSGRIRVTFPYSPEVVARLRTVKTRKWHPDGKYWSFERPKAVMDEILSALAGTTSMKMPSKKQSKQQRAWRVWTNP